ncbi:MAG: hypothetical protein OEW83_19590 [Acidimicrobiia bacterium]|nr:hypothetical protein [Acidimicrobiia bacterium]
MGAALAPALYGSRGDDQHATRKLLPRVKQPPVDANTEATTTLGNWYANKMPWRPEVAILVNETTLLPVYIALAPAATLIERIPAQVTAVLTELGLPADAIEREAAAMSEPSWAKTANRSVVGVMNEFVFLADHHRWGRGGVAPDLIELSVQMSETPCSPLYSTYISPCDAVRAAFDRPE